LNRDLEATAGIAARVDALPVTPLHGAIVVLCALGLLFDVVEAALSNALSAVFSAPLQPLGFEAWRWAAGTCSLRRIPNRNRAAAGGLPCTPFVRCDPRVRPLHPSAWEIPQKSI
jgi:hypothetical protein